MGSILGTYGRSMEARETKLRAQGCGAWLGRVFGWVRSGFDRVMSGRVLVGSGETEIAFETFKQFSKPAKFRNPFFEKNLTAIVIFENSSCSCLKQFSKLAKFRNPFVEKKI